MRAVSEYSSPQPVDLEALMHRYQQSDSEAAAELVNQLSPQIYQFYLAHVRDRPLAEDLLQDFWLRIHSARRTYRPGEPVLPWLYAIARRVRIDHYRHTKRWRDHEMPREYFAERAASQHAPPATSARMEELLETLPATQQEVILLLKVSGLSLEEVARATGTSVGAVKQKAHRAYEKLRAVFGGKT